VLQFYNTNIEYPLRRSHYIVSDTTSGKWHHKWVYDAHMTGRDIFEILNPSGMINCGRSTIITRGQQLLEAVILFINTYDFVLHIYTHTTINKVKRVDGKLKGPVNI